MHLKVYIVYEHITLLSCKLSLQTKHTDIRFCKNIAPKRYKWWKCEKVIKTLPKHKICLKMKVIV